MARIRRDIARLQPGWNNTLLWYARAVRDLQKLPINERTSWKFLGAMHGFDADAWRARGVLTQGQQPPADLVNNTFGDQCQHGSWYFLPWHRGYLAAFEAIVAAKIKELGGPGDDWALPYWNYLNNTPNARRFPQPFLDATLPDGSPNPLSAPPRANNVQVLAATGGIPDINLLAMNEPDFVVGANDPIGFGGGLTHFSRSSNRAGDLERNPHNPVHVMIGGFQGGYMSDPNFAGLDPIFWIHHCNIDRLWEAWMSDPTHTMVRDPIWLDGPPDRRFIMPGATIGAAPFNFTARQTLKGGSLHPTYDDIFTGTGIVAPAAPGGVSVSTMGSTRDQQVDVIGASDSGVRVGNAPAKVRVRLHPGNTAAAVTAMGPIEVGKQVSRLYLQLDNIKGSTPSAVVDVYLNLPDSASAGDADAYRADTLYLFGLAKASADDGPHGGNGLGFTIDITDVAARLKQSDQLGTENLDVSVVPRGGASEETPISVGQVRILRRNVRASD